MKKWAAVLCLVFGFLGAEKVGALNFWEFNPGRIIDDAVFYNANAMSATEIQRFLDAKVPVCETNWESHGYMWAVAPCLKDYREDTRTRAADAFCEEYVGRAGQSAAEIIWGVGQACGINPQVILVILQKEQGLVTDKWPRDSWLNNSAHANYQYRSAMGMGCPDNAACNSEYYGFFNQVYYGARQYKRYQATPNSYTYRAGRNNDILWNPERWCGSSTVYIENQATAGLYNYTPYRPNDAALGAGWGTGDSCSSYGNRNFWAYFTSWFGSAYYNDQFEDMETPRYMEIIDSTQKIDLDTGRRTDQILVPGQLIFFKMKTGHDGEYCLRSEYDTERNYQKCVPMSELREYRPVFTELSGGNVRMEVAVAGNKFDLVTQRVVEAMAAGRVLSVVDQVYFDGVLYYRVAEDADRGLDYVVRAGSLREVTQFSEITPVVLRLDNDSAKTLPGASVVGEVYPGGMRREFVSVTNIAGRTYYRTEFDAANGYSLGFAEDSLLPAYNEFAPVMLSLSGDAQKSDFTGRKAGDVYPAGTSRAFIGRAKVGGRMYYFTEYDRGARVRGLGFEGDDLVVEFVPMEYPRIMRLKVDAQKYWPLSGEVVAEDGVFGKGMERMFMRKVEIDGEVYLQTEYDIENETQKVFPMSLLEEVY